LKNLPVDYLKIDGLFIRDMLEDPVDLVIVKSIHHITKALGKKIVAEFVENKSILDLLKKIGIDFAQGNYIAEERTFKKIHNDSMGNVIKFSKGSNVK